MTRTAHRKWPSLLDWLSRPGRRALLSGVTVVGILVAMVALGPLILSSNPVVQDLRAPLSPPSSAHWLGTDELGRDLLDRLLIGGRRSILIGLGAGLGAFMIGTPIGLVCGSGPRWLDIIMMRVMDLFLALPGILIAIAIVVAFGNSSFGPLLAITIVSVPAFARLARAEALRLREREFVLIVRLAGGRYRHTLRTILRNSIAPLLVQIILTITVAILIESGLSYLGLGPPPPEPSWGQMLRSSQKYLYESSLYGLAPGAMLTLLTLGFGAIGTGLRALMVDDHGRTDVA